MISLKLLAHQLLLGCPSDGNSSFKHLVTKTEDTKQIFLPRELSRIKLAFAAPVVLFVSSNNPGASKTAARLQKGMVGLSVTSEKPTQFGSGKKLRQKVTAGGIGQLVGSGRNLLAGLVASVGGASGSADTTFVLVDRMLLLSLRASLNLVPAPASTAHAPGATAVAAFAAQVQRAAPWRAAVAVAAARPAAAGPSADDAARALRRDLKDAKHKARRETGAAIAALRRLTASRNPGLNDPWALPRVTNEFFDALSAINPDGCSDGRKLAETADGDALAALLDVLRFAAGLDALSQKQQARRPAR